MRLTVKKLEELEALAREATAGPWVPKHLKTIYTSGRAEHEVRSLATGDTLAVLPLSGDESEAVRDARDADCSLMARAREDVPALIAEVRRLRARVETLEKGLVRCSVPEHDVLELMCLKCHQAEVCRLREALGEAE